MATFTGTENDDLLPSILALGPVLALGDDEIFGLGGDDTLIGYTGDDLLEGGAGLTTFSAAYST